MPSVGGIFAATLLSYSVEAAAMTDALLIIDDRSSGDYRSSLGTTWRLVTDAVMGGVSSGQLTLDKLDGRNCLRLRGEVRLENSGGFVQAALDVGATSAADASHYRGLLLEVYGNAEDYNLHLRTDAVRLPWQAYRASFTARPGWHTLHLPFDSFKGYRLDAPLDPAHLQRIGIVAIGKAYQADLCVASIAFYS